jgi:hypothetical protein
MLPAGSDSRTVLPGHALAPPVPELEVVVVVEAPPDPLLLDVVVVVVVVVGVVVVVVVVVVLEVVLLDVPPAPPAPPDDEHAAATRKEGRTTRNPARDIVFVRSGWPWLRLQVTSIGGVLSIAK